MKEVKTENGQNEEREKGWMKWKEGKMESGMKERKRGKIARFVNNGCVESEG